MAKTIKITDDGLKKLQEELETLKTQGRADIAEKIKVARGYGDLSENSEDELLIRTQKYYGELHGAFSVFEEELSDLALSSAIKHCYISSGALYRDFLQNNVE